MGEPVRPDEQLDATAARQSLVNEFSKHRSRLHQVVQFRMDRRLAGRVDPEDVLQEAFINASDRVQNLPDGDETTVFVWLRMIVEQTLIDVHRRHVGAQMRSAAREVSMARQAGNNTTYSLAACLLGSLTSPSQAAIRSELADRLKDALDSMDAIDREVLALRHFEELTNKEVAEVLGIQQKAASIRYVRALERLKRILADLPGFNEGA